MLEFVGVVAGLAILVFAGDALVRGAVNLALRLGISAMIVSLTIVAFGTSAPELLIGVDSVLNGVPGLALGNVVGSNTANVLLVLGVPALIAGVAASEEPPGRALIQMLLGTLLFIMLCFSGILTWWHGAILLIFMAGILTSQISFALAARSEREEEPEGADPTMPSWKIGTFLVAGMVGLPLGADLLVTNASSIASRLGVSDTVIGLTLVAIGTSLPELATTVTAALRRQSDVALGNVIGSNLFNLLVIMGVTAMVGPVPVPQEFLRFDLWVMFATSLILVPIVYKNLHLGRGWGVALCALYVIYLVVVFQTEV